MSVVINGDTGISGVNGSAGNPAIKGSDADTGIHFGTDTAAITTGGTDRVSIDSTGAATFSGNVSAVDGTLTGALAVTGDARMASLNNGQLAGRRNYVDNGAFQIFQRGPSGSNNVNFNGRPRTADRWTMRGHTDVGAVINWEIADGGTGRARSTICDKTVADAFRFEFPNAVTGSWGILQFLEPTTFKKFNGKTLTLSFVSSVNHSDWSIYIQSSGDGAHFFSLNSTSVNPYGSTGFVVSGSVTIPDGTFNDADGLTSLYFYNTADMSVGDSVDVSLIQLEEGPVATPYEIRTYADDLAHCQRYLYHIDAPEIYTRFGLGLANGTTSCQAIIHFPVTMRIRPSSFEAASSGLYQASNGSVGFTGTDLTMTGNVRCANSAVISLTTSGLNVNHSYFIEANGNVAGTKFMRFSAEF